MTQGGVGIIDWSIYPPAPITWLSNFVDTLCEPLGCTDHWRSALLPSQWTQPTGAYFSPEFQMARPITTLLPPLTTYKQFLQQNPNNDASLFSNVYEFATQTPSTVLGDLTTPHAMWTVLFMVVVLRRIKSVLLPFFSKLGRQAGRHTHGPDWEAANEIRIVKFGEYVFRLVFHTCVSLAGIYYFYDAPWWKAGGTSSLFEGFPHQDIAPGMAWYYLLQSSYNMDAMMSLLEMSLEIQFPTKGKSNKLSFPRLAWSENCRGDFREMCIHHVVTNLLIIGSSMCRLTRVGSMVFLVHDISDVPVDLSKLANFLKWKTTTAICFVSMVLVWCVTRLGILPFLIFRSVLSESWMVCASGVIDPVYYVHYQPLFVILMGMLILLHFAWFSMFLKMGYVLVAKGEAHDLSEHKKGEKHNDHRATSTSTTTTAAKAKHA